MRDPEHGHRTRGETPVLITAAEPSYSEQYATRRRKYAILMSARVPCLVLAGVFYQTWWLALAFLLLSVPLPWMAVLIANDRAPRKAERVNRFRRDPHGRELESRDHPVIDG
ncbi:MAG TPA: DUF3099 domain-containing protein [Pseudonocardiaceae bacterium]|nr:DUF3099 domain-containing protein [Pseudonocardiaceae bacterium]